MALTVYHYPACSTCRRALKWLDEREIPHTRIHIVEQPPSRQLLAQALARTGSPRALFNTSGQSYRDGNFKERLPKMSEDEALDALAADGKLIKRPFAVAEGIALTGFDEATWQRALK